MVQEWVFGNSPSMKVIQLSSVHEES